MVTLALVEPGISTETLRAVEYLRQEISAGRIVGIAWVAVHPARKWTVDFAGEAKAAPAFARGAVWSLAAELDKLDNPK